jgi:hypothetical protein
MFATPPRCFAKQRRYQRYAYNNPVRAQIYWGEGSLLNMGGRCREIGEGGAGVSLDSQLRPGEVISLELLPGVKVYAAVRYLRGSYHGVEFVLVRDQAREAIHRICESLAPRAKSKPATQSLAS